MISRDINNPRKAVVRVKGKKANELNTLEFKQYVDDGCLVYLYDPKIINLDQIEHVIKIEDSDLLAFYEENKMILLTSITLWEDLFVGK